MSFFTYLKDSFQGKNIDALGVTHRRSSEWPVIREAFLALNPSCKVCKATSKLEVHHIVPFHVDPSLELMESNLVTLCVNKKYGINCHLAIGHRGNFRNFNEAVLEDAALWNGKIFK